MPVTGFLLSAITHSFLPGPRSPLSNLYRFYTFFRHPARGNGHFLFGGRKDRTGGRIPPYRETAACRALIFQNLFCAAAVIRPLSRYIPCRCRSIRQGTAGFPP